MSLDVNADVFIDQAISDGQERGLAALGDLARLVYVTSEAETCCDMDGIDAFIDRHGATGLMQLAQAYRAIGAELIAAACRTVLDAMPTPDEHVLDQLNTSVCERVGYDYESLRSLVVRELGA